MVGVAQLVERWIVAPEVVGSNPIVHPKLAVAGCFTFSASLSIRAVSSVGRAGDS